MAWGQSPDSTRKFRPIAVYPAFGFQPETSFQVGLVAVMVLKGRDQSQTSFERQSTMNPFILYTFKRQVLTEFPIDYFFRNGFNLNLAPRYFDFPDSFYGIGNDKDPDNFETYTNQFWQLAGQLYIPVSEKTFVGAAIDVHYTRLKDFKEGGELENGTVNGINGGTLAGIGPALKYDTRDYAIYPAKGFLISSQFIPIIAGDFSYSSFLLDVRRYITIKNPRNILALQFNTRIISGNNIPFYKLPQLGGAERLRGIANASLYRDENSFFTQVEYRKHLVWRLGMVAFMGVGDVASRLQDYRINEFKYVGGAGLRFAAIPDKKVNLRFDFGVASGGQTGFYVGMSEAF